MELPHDANRPNPVEPAPDSPEAEQAAATPSGWLRRNGPLLLLIVAFFLFLRFYFGVTYEGFKTGVIVALGLGFVIFIHELGHFAVAKWCDVHVETFSIGFGPPLPGCAFRWGETLYKIALFPLGGYVKMVGEGAESDESDDDPRSFKNKPVWQRMAIISAGVTMNLILAFFCFVFVFLTHGDEQPPGVIGLIVDGGPVWQTPAHTGYVIYRIGDKGEQPSYEVLQKEVMNSTPGQALDFVVGPPNAPASQLVHTKLVPRKEPGDKKRVIGLAPALQLRLYPKRASRVYGIPAVYGSAASRAEPAFAFDDVIVATTDPNHPEKVKDLPPDPRHPEHPDYFEFHRRMDRLAGQAVTIQVERGPEGQPKERIDIRVLPAYRYTLGLRMRMGPVAAVRENSPAAKAGIQPGDIIEKVEVGGAQARQPLQKALDPDRLPYDLAQWAARASDNRSVTLTVVRMNPPPDHNERRRQELTLTWDDSWRDDIELPLNSRAPLSVSGLGLAYLVETAVEGVQPDSPAAKAGIQPGDVLKEVQFYTSGKTPDAPAKPQKWQALQPEHWPFLAYNLQLADAKQIGFRLARPAAAGAKPGEPEGSDKPPVEVVLTAQEDPTWAVSDRGLRLQYDEWIFKADNLGQALRMGWNKSWFFIEMLFGNLRGLVTGQLDPANFVGPIGIAEIAYFNAAESIFKFIVFLGIIGVNLAVVNFLPIPVLDGGHMVFLIYEKLRGQPAPERVRVAASLAGLALILCLMGFVVYLDLSRW